MNLHLDRQFQPHDPPAHLTRTWAAAWRIGHWAAFACIAFPNSDSIAMCDNQRAGLHSHLCRLAFDAGFITALLDHAVQHPAEASANLVELIGECALIPAATTGRNN